MGAFIVFEGPDFVGKSLQVGMLAGRLAYDAHLVITLAFPGKTSFGVAARQCLTNVAWSLEDVALRAVVTQACMTADRYAHAEEIRSTRQRGDIVIADRWTTSGLVYGQAEGMHLRDIANAQQDLPVPNLQFLLMAPFEVLRQRAQARAGLDRYEGEAFARQVYSLYERQAALDSDLIVIDADRDAAVVATDIYERVRALLR